MASSRSARTDNNDAGDFDAEVETNAAEQEALARLQDMSIERVLQMGHEAAIRLLTARVIAGTASHQELAILRNVLRDNGLTLTGRLIEGNVTKPLPLPADTDIPLLDAPDYND